MDALYVLFTLFCTKSAILPLFAVVTRYQSAPPYIRTLACWMIVSLVTEIIAVELMRNFLRMHNNIVYNIYTILEFGFIALFFYQYSRIERLRKTVLVLIPVFTLFCVLDMAFLEGWHEMNSYSLGVSSILLLMLILVMFFELSNDISQAFIENAPVFWILIGLLIYFAGTFFVYISANQLVDEDPVLSGQLWDINSLLLLVRNILFCVGILKIPRR